MIPQKIILGFLASHGGSNMQAIIDGCKTGQINAVPAVVISNNSDSGAIIRAKKEGIPYYHISTITHPEPEVHDRAIIQSFETHGVNLVILAGYMKKLGDAFIKHYHNRILNIHPALLPKFGGEGMYGLNVHRAVIAAGEKESGATVHIVNELYDRGRILAQRIVPVYTDDTPETLAARVLEQEHILYPDTIRKIAEGRIVLD